MKKEYIKFLIRFLILFIVVEGLIMLNFIVFSDNPLTWSEFLRGIPYMLLACLAVVFFRGLVFMSPKNKKDSQHSYGPVIRFIFHDSLLMFPFIIQYRKRLSSDFDLIPNETILINFRNNLKSDGVDKLWITNNSILNFRNYFFAIRPGLNWNIWVGISSGKIEIEKYKNYRNINYLINTSRFFIVGTFSAILFWAFSEELLAGLLAFTVLGLVNWIISIIRHRLHLNDLLEEVIRNDKIARNPSQ